MNNNEFADIVQHAVERCLRAVHDLRGFGQQAGQDCNRLGMKPDVSYLMLIFVTGQIGGQCMEYDATGLLQTKTGNGQWNIGDFRLVG